jgi:hypothetical protein
MLWLCSMRGAAIHGSHAELREVLDSPFFPVAVCLAGAIGLDENAVCLSDSTV